MAKKKDKGKHIRILSSSASKAKRREPAATREQAEMLEKTFARKPSIKYSDELAERVLRRMVDGETLTQICRDADMPCDSTVRNWALDKPVFRARYERAAMLQVERWVDEVKEIADDGRNDWMEKESKRGTYVSLNSEHVTRSMLRINTIKWLASVRDPEKYGAKLEAGKSLQDTASSFARAVDSANNTKPTTAEDANGPVSTH